MTKYRVSASVMIKVYHLDIDIECPPELGHTVEHAVMNLLNDRLTILNQKETRSYKHGIISPILSMNVEITGIAEE